MEKIAQSVPQAGASDKSPDQPTDETALVVCKPERSFLIRRYLDGPSMGRWNAFRDNGTDVFAPHDDPFVIADDLAKLIPGSFITLVLKSPPVAFPFPPKPESSTLVFRHHWKEWAIARAEFRKAQEREATEQAKQLELDRLTQAFRDALIAAGVPAQGVAVTLIPTCWDPDRNLSQWMPYAVVDGMHFHHASGDDERVLCLAASERDAKREAQNIAARFARSFASQEELGDALLALDVYQKSEDRQDNRDSQNEEADHASNA